MDGEKSKPLVAAGAVAGRKIGRVLLMMALALGFFATTGILTVLLLSLSDPLAAPARLLSSLGLAAG